MPPGRDSGGITSPVTSAGISVGMRNLEDNGLHGSHNVLIAGAAAEVAVDPARISSSLGTDCRSRRSTRGHDHARRAESTLQAVLFPEGVLDRVKLAVRGEALDRVTLRAVGLHGEDGARLHRRAVQEDGAGAALARVAADVRAGETERVAQEMDEQQAGLDLALVNGAVDGDPRLRRHARSSFTRSRLEVCSNDWATM